MKRAAKQNRARQTAQYIQIAAAQLLVSDGYNAASTNKIAKKAGVSVGSIYQYFSGKDDIFENIIQSDMNALVAKLSSYELQPQLTKQKNFQAFMMIGNENELLSSGAYAELSRQRHFRDMLRNYARSIQTEIADFLRSLDLDLSEARLVEMARLLHFTAQGLVRGNDSEGKLPDALLEEFLTMTTSYVFGDSADP